MQNTNPEITAKNNPQLNEERIKELAPILPEALYQVPKVQTFRSVEKPEDAKMWADYWFAMISQCQQTEGFSGYLKNQNGQLEFYRGTDYMYLSAQRILQGKKDYFSPDNIKDISLEEYRLWYLDDRGYVGTKDEKINERYALMCETIKELHGKYGDFQRLVKAAGNRLAGEGGVFARLKEIGAYKKDGEQKKSRLLTMFLSEIGAVEFEDPENLQCPIDYHIMRVLLRTEVIDLSGCPELKNKLIKQLPCTEEEDNELRGLANEAIHRLNEVSGVSMGELNHLFWSLGRMYCFRDKNNAGIVPECEYFNGKDLLIQDEIDNPYRTEKELEKRIVPSCPINKVCIGKRTEIENLLHEPNIITFNY